MKFTIRHGLLACLVAVFSLMTQAQEFRIGYVNTERILNESNTSKAATSKLERAFSKREKELKEFGIALKTATENFDRDGLTMPLDLQRVAKRKLEDQERDFQRRRQEFQEDVAARKNDEMQLINAKAVKVIGQIAKAEKYNMILQDVMYVDAEHDITDIVIRAMDAAN